MFILVREILALQHFAYLIRDKTTISDLISIPPHEFYKSTRDELEDKINEKYSNRIVQKVGLCMFMWDLLSASDGLIGHGTGNVNVNVEFRLLVFRPFKGEIILGKISGQTSQGLHISTDFFDDISVPSSLLFQGSSFRDDETGEVNWVWDNADQSLWYDVGAVVRLRVEAEYWEDQAPGRVQKAVVVASEGLKNATTATATTTNGDKNGGATGQVNSVSAAAADGEVKRRVPYCIVGSMMEEGLGDVDWW